VDELLGAILGAIAEFLLEAFLELIAAAVLDLASRALLGLFRGVAEAVKGNRRPNQSNRCRFVLSAVGGVLRRLGRKVTPVETFGYGFAFALGMAVFRFLFAK